MVSFAGEPGAVFRPGAASSITGTPVRPRASSIANQRGGAGSARTRGRAADRLLLGEPRRAGDEQDRWRDFMKLRIRTTARPTRHIHATGVVRLAAGCPEYVKEHGRRPEETTRGSSMREYIYDMPQVMAAAGPGHLPRGRRVDDCRGLPRRPRRASWCRRRM